VRITLAVALYVSDFRVGDRLRVFEDKVLKRIFGMKRDQMTGGWMKLHKDLHYLYYSPSIIRKMKPKRMRWAEHLARMWRRGFHIGF
jgi:hypothetical protein